MSAGEYLSKIASTVGDFRQGRSAVQAAALCYRVRQSGTIETLLLSSRGSGRWIIPKGNIDLDEQPHQAARREAFEEAGVIGKVEKLPLGYYSYIKSPTKPLYLVSVFRLLVTEVEDDFPEKGQRIRQWVEPHEAAALVDEPELRDLFSLPQSRSGLKK